MAAVKYIFKPNKKGMKKIIFSESALTVIKESEEEVTFYRFFVEIKKVLKNLLSDPFNIEMPDFFKKHGISKTTLMNKMLNKGLITKTEKINEPVDAEGNKHSMHYLKYTVPKKNFEQKIHRLYSYFFENK